MNETITLNLSPLSVNKAWQGKRFATAEYKRWTEWGLLLLKKVKRCDEPQKLEITFYLAKQADIDNPIKPFLDLLKKAGVIEDDRKIEMLVVKKVVSKERKIEFRFL